jgi:hypothetical protein
LGAAPATPEDDRLGVLMTLVDAYERQKWPDKMRARKLLSWLIRYPV